MSAQISLEHFAQTAQRALHIGGSLDINKDNELVVKGSTWFGRQVQWFKQHLFPDKVRQQNQRVLEVFNQTLHREAGVEGNHPVSAKILGSAKLFTREVADASSVHYRQQGLQRNKAIARRQGQAYFETDYRFGSAFARGISRGEKALFQHISRLDDVDRMEVKERYLTLLESVVSDRQFMSSHGGIPEGSGERYQDSEGNLSTSLLRAAYMVTAESAYEQDHGKTVPHAGRGEDHYGLNSEADVAWLRRKLEQL